MSGAPLSNHLSELADRAREYHERHKTANREAVESYLAGGATLVEAKGEAGHGNWLPFLERAGIPERTAQNMMLLSRCGIKSGTVSYFDGIASTLDAVRGYRQLTGKLPEDFEDLSAYAEFTQYRDAQSRADEMMVAKYNRTLEADRSAFADLLKAAVKAWESLWAIYDERKAKAILRKEYGAKAAREGFDTLWHFEKHMRLANAIDATGAACPEFIDWVKEN